MLLDELRGHLPGGRGKSGAGVDTLLSCVEAVLTSRSLQHVYTNRIDTMVTTNMQAHCSQGALIDN